MKKKLFFLFTVFPSLVCGLLPPLYETLSEFKLLINDERLPKYLQSGDVLLSIERKDEKFHSGSP